MNKCLYFWHLKRNINSIFDYLHFIDWDNISLRVLNGYKMWDWNNFFNNLLNDFFDFNYFGNHPVNLKNIININYIHYLLSNHSNNTFINLWLNTCLKSDPLHLLQQGFNQNSEMELDFSTFLATVSINILHLYDVRFIFYYFHQSV